MDSRSKELGVEVFPGQRVQVSKSRFRVSELTIVRSPEPAEDIFTSPPFLCIEILSKDDTMMSMQERIDDYLNFGVPYVWIINPKTRKAYIVTRNGMVEARNRPETVNPAISVPLSVLFD